MNVTEAIIKLCRPHPEIKKIILFGSRARGDAKSRSDFDIAIVCNSMSETQWLLLRDKLEEIPTLLGLDIIRFDTASKNLQNKILHEGEIIYEQGKSTPIFRKSK